MRDAGVFELILEVIWGTIKGDPTASFMFVVFGMPIFQFLVTIIAVVFFLKIRNKQRRATWLTAISYVVTAMGIFTILMLLALSGFSFSGFKGGRLAYVIFIATLALAGPVLCLWLARLSRKEVRRESESAANILPEQ